MQDQQISYPLTGLTPKEMESLAQQTEQAQVVDPTIEEMIDTPFGRFGLQTRNWASGALGWSLGQFVGNTFTDDFTDPLNYEVRKADVDGLKDPVSWMVDNNPEGITRLLEGIDQDELPWVLTAKTWGEFQDRLRYVKSATPEAQEAAGFGLGNVYGMATDIAAFAALSSAAEGLMFAGLPVRSLAGRTTALAAGRAKTQEMGIAAAEAARSVSRLNLGARGLAYGLAEETVWQGIRNGIDPSYDPDASEVIQSLIISGTTMGLIGGSNLGRRFLADRIEDTAAGFAAMRMVDLPGGYQVKYAPGFAFTSPAAADAMLFARGTGSLADEARRVGDELWEDWSKPGRRADFGIPGAAGTTRSVVKAAAFELSLSGVALTKEVFAKVAEALVQTESKKLIAGAFNKDFWETIAREFPNTPLRPVGQRTFIGGIDNTLKDLAFREDMIDATYDYFRWNKDLEPDAPKSLIFQVLREIKDRGGVVDRKVVSEIVDELREIAQRPPRRVNARGASRIDYNARRLAVVEAINKRAKSDKKIFISPSLVRNMTPTQTINAASRLGRWTGKVGTDPEFKDVPQVARWYDRIPVWNRIGNRSALLHESDNGALRLAATMGSEARRSFDTAQALTLREQSSQAYHSLLASFIKGYRNGFIRYALGGGKTNVTRNLSVLDVVKATFRDRKKREAFNTRVIAQAERREAPDAVEAVNNAARQARESLDAAYAIAQQAGLPGFLGKGLDNYFPWLWRHDMIRRLASTPAGKEDLIRLLKEDFGDSRIVEIDGVAVTFTGDIDAAARVLAERLIRIANGSENAPLIAQDREWVDALGELEGPLKAQIGSRSPFGRSRIRLSRTAEIQTTADHLNNGKGTLSMQDLRNTDVPHVVRRYLASVVGAAYEKRYYDAMHEQAVARGYFSATVRDAAGRAFTENDRINSFSKLEGFINRIGPPMDETQRAALNEIVGAIRLAPANEGRIGVGDKLTNLIGAYAYTTTGGWFGAAQATEVGRIAGTVGVGTMFRSMPILKEMTTNWKNVDLPTQNYASFIEANFSPAVSRTLRMFKDEIGSPVNVPIGVGGPLRTRLDRTMDRSQRMLDSMSNVYSDITGLAPNTSMTQMLAAAGIIQHLFDVTKYGVSRLDNATIRALGLEPDQYEMLVRYVQKNAETTQTFMGERVSELRNLDAVEMDYLKAFVQRFVESRIQSVPTRGDFHQHLFTFWGRALTQFQTFNLKGIDNFLIQNAGRVARGAQLRVAQEIAFTGLTAGLLHWGRNYAQWRSYVASGDEKRAEDMEKTLTVEGVLRGVVMGPSEFFLLTRAGDAIATTVYDDDPIFSPYRYSGLKWYSFPAEAMAVRAGSVLGKVWASTAGQALDLPIQREFTQGDAHRGRLLLPAQNFPGWQQLLNFTEQQVVDAYDLPKTAPRDRD